MVIGEVVGNIVSTVKHGIYKGTKLLIIQPLTPNLEKQGETFLAIDFANSGIGEIVLVVREGSALGPLLGKIESPVASAVVGVIDRIDMGRKKK